jgi:hypothetical protein
MDMQTASPIVEGIQSFSLVSHPEAADSINFSLAPEEVETLQSLIGRYDRVIQDLDTLNAEIEKLLAQESIKACES